MKGEVEELVVEILGRIRLQSALLLEQYVSREQLLERNHLNFLK